LSYYADPDAWSRGADFIIDKIKNDSKFIDFVVEKNEAFGKEVFTEIEKLEKINS